MARAWRGAKWRRTILVILGIVAIIAPAPASAAFFPCDLQGTYGRGWSSTLQANWFEGASANLVYRDGAVCGADGTYANASLVWTMVADGSDPAQGWAQSGRIYRPDIGCWRHFAQQLRRRGLYPAYTKIGACTSAGQVFHVWQQTIFVGGTLRWAIRSNIGLTTLIDSSQTPPEYGGPWSQFSSWTAPFVVSFAGETKYNNSDIPGYATSKSDFSPPGQTPMQVQSYIDDTWHNTCGYATLALTDPDPQNRYAADAPSCSNVRTWTK